MRITNEAQSPTILRDVGRSIKQFILNHLTDLGDQSIHFDSPAEAKEMAQPQVSLFLLEIQAAGEMDYHALRTPNQELRSAPLPVELTLMITPMAKSREQEFTLLEKLIRLFYDRSQLSGAELLDSLGYWQETLNINRRLFRLEEVQQIWSMLGGKNYRPSLFYTVGKVWIQSGSVEGYVPVERVEIEVVLHPEPPTTLKGGK